ncbi:MAG: hypothetical protein ACYDCO_00930 [Armatimonadota bacterium]
MSQPPTDPCEIPPPEQATGKRVNKLAVASFAIAAFIPLLYLFAYYNPRYYIDDIMISLDGNLAALPVWLILPVLGFVLGVKAKEQCVHRPSLTGRWWATMGIYLSIATGIALVYTTTMNASSWPHYSGFYCAQNIRQLSYAAQLYAQDHQGTLPRQWSDLDPYILSRYTLTCPRYFGKESTGYGYNQAVTGKKIASIKEADSLLLFADSNNTDGMIRSRADIDDQRHETGPGHGLYWHVGPWPRVFVVSYVDGHATILKLGAQVRLNPNLSFPRHIGRFRNQQFWVWYRYASPPSLPTPVFRVPALAAVWIEGEEILS